MGRFLSGILTLGLAAALLVAVSFIWAQQRFSSPGPATSAVMVVVERGSGLKEIAQGFEDQGAISDAWLFASAAQLMGVANLLQAGEYEVPAQASMAEVLALVTEGRAVQHRITVAEGRTVREVIATLEKSKVLLGSVEKLPVEGSLAPDTYFVIRGEQRQAVLNRMLAAQKQRVEALWAERRSGLPVKTMEEAVILASIVEKETGLSGERALVASVFVNRLRKGMRLQSDPTVVYGITLGAPGGLGRGLRKSELKNPTPYNTYAIEALPPTAIANPGKAALEAVLNPAESDYLYFVADGSGGHAFAKTYPEHQRNVAVWRQIEKRRAAEAESQ